MIVHIGFASDRVVVRDFGIAALLAHDGPEVAAARAPYRAPELWRDASAAGPAADVYALGCIAFELLGHVPPLPAATLADAMASHTGVEPPLVRTAEPEVVARGPGADRPHAREGRRGSGPPPSRSATSSPRSVAAR